MFPSAIIVQTSELFTSTIAAAAACTTAHTITAAVLIFILLLMFLRRNFSACTAARANHPEHGSPPEAETKSLSTVRWVWMDAWQVV